MMWRWCWVGHHSWLGGAWVGGSRVYVCRRCGKYKWGGL